MYYLSKIGHNNLFLEQSTKKKSKNLKKELQILKRFYKNFYLIICLFISYFQEREVNKENRIKAEQAKNARLEALKEKALAEEAERQAKAEARKAEILAGKIFTVATHSRAPSMLTYTFTAMAGGYDKQAAMDKRRALRPGKKNKKDKKTATMATMGADGQSTTVQA